MVTSVINYDQKRLAIEKTRKIYLKKIKLRSQLAAIRNIDLENSDFNDCGHRQITVEEELTLKLQEELPENDKLEIVQNLLAQLEVDIAGLLQLIDEVREADSNLRREQKNLNKQPVSIISALHTKLESDIDPFWANFRKQVHAPL